MDLKGEFFHFFRLLFPRPPYGTRGAPPSAPRGICRGACVPVIGVVKLSSEKLGTRLYNK